MVEAFEEGKTHIFPTSRTPLITPQYEDMDDFDVKAAYDHVMVNSLKL